LRAPPFEHLLSTTSSRPHPFDHTLSTISVDNHLHRQSPPFDNHLCRQSPQSTPTSVDTHFRRHPLPSTTTSVDHHLFDNPITTSRPVVLPQHQQRPSKTSRYLRKTSTPPHHHQPRRTTMCFIRPITHVCGHGYLLVEAKCWNFLNGRACFNIPLDSRASKNRCTVCRAHMRFFWADDFGKRW
jgi:hypothetical protein